MAAQGHIPNTFSAATLRCSVPLGAIRTVPRAHMEHYSARPEMHQNTSFFLWHPRPVRGERRRRRKSRRSEHGETRFRSTCWHGIRTGGRGQTWCWARYSKHTDGSRPASMTHTTPLDGTMPKRVDATITTSCHHGSPPRPRGGAPTQPRRRAHQGHVADDGFRRRRGVP